MSGSLFHMGILPQDSGSLKSELFPLLGDLPKVIEIQLPVCQLYRWQLDHYKSSIPTTKLLDSIVVTALWVGYPWKTVDPHQADLSAIVRCQRRQDRRRPKEIALNNWHIFLPLFAMRQIAAKNRMDTILILQC